MCEGDQQALPVGWTYCSGVCRQTGALRCVAVPEEAAAEYRRLCASVPRGVALWSDEAAMELLEELEGGEDEAFARVVVVLAHHRSELACKVLHDLYGQAPEDLRPLAELAWAQALGWLGWEYRRRRGWPKAQIRPAQRDDIG